MLAWLPEIGSIMAVTSFLPYSCTDDTSEVDACIVNQIKLVLHILKSCNTEQQRKEYILLLRALAPILKKERDKSGMVKKIAKRLEVPHGSRGCKGKKVNYAFTDAVLAAEDFHDKAKLAATPLTLLCVGDDVLCRGQLAKVAEYDAESGRCSITFCVGEQLDGGSSIQKTVNYAAAFGKGPQSARLQRPPATLMPPPRRQRSDALSMVRGPTLTPPRCPKPPPA